MYDSIYTGGQVDKGIGRSYVPTLNSAPTSATLTFTLEGNTVDFEIGQTARVANQNYPEGYAYYKLVDITEAGNVKTAHWVVLASKPTYKRIYHEVSNPTGDPSDQGWYELVSGVYVATSDTSVVSGKTYYTQTNFYTMVI